MTQACANPLLYGWLNDNFRKEFHKIGTSFVARTKNDATTDRPRSRMSTVVPPKAAPSSERPVAEGGSANLQPTGANTAVTMLASPTGPASRYRTQVTVVTHLVPEPSPAVYRVNEPGSAPPEQHL